MPWLKVAIDYFCKDPTQSGIGGGLTKTDFLELIDWHSHKNKKPEACQISSTEKTLFDEVGNYDDFTESENLASSTPIQNPNLSETEEMEIELLDKTLLVPRPGVKQFEEKKEDVDDSDHEANVEMEATDEENVLIRATKRMKTIDGETATTATTESFDKKRKSRKEKELRRELKREMRNNLKKKSKRHQAESSSIIPSCSSPQLNDERIQLRPSKLDLVFNNAATCGNQPLPSTPSASSPSSPTPSYSSTSSSSSSGVSSQPVTRTRKRPGPKPGPPKTQEELTCKLCPLGKRKAYSSVGNLNKHTRLYHSNSSVTAPTFLCTWKGCTFTSKLKWDMNLHLESHKKPEERTKFKCSACDVSYLRIDACRTHIKKRGCSGLIQEVSPQSQSTSSPA